MKSVHNPNRLLKGVKGICDAFDLNKDQYYTFVALGMPVCRINGRLYGHHKNIDEWLQKVTNPKITKKRDMTVDVSKESDLSDVT